MFPGCSCSLCFALAVLFFALLHLTRERLELVIHVGRKSGFIDLVNMEDRVVKMSSVLS
jgi:hypothetical protein